jgi:phenylpropionate dioxygenase-like ring-hydroxylating dioxygenase large terminal subunit
MSGILRADELAAVRQPYRSATQLPPRVFHDQGVYEFERREWFGRDWLCVGRVEDVPTPGSYLLAEPAGQGIVVVRDGSGGLRAFHNACRHRGARLLDQDSGALDGCIRCPYHAWSYELTGALRTAPYTRGVAGFDKAGSGLLPVRCATWQGFVFVSLAGATALADHLGDLPANLARFELAELRRARRISYEVAANWKVICENYSECAHCPGVHPQLNRISRYDSGADFAAVGEWKGGYMELGAGFATMSTDGQCAGRLPLPGMSTVDTRRVYFYLVWPNLLLSLHPDYLMAHQVWPLAPGRSLVHCDWYVHPDALAGDLSGVVDFWDLTNRQDWAVCELQQRGTASPAYPPGRYTELEDAVHAFDLMCADRYAADGVRTRRGGRLDLVDPSVA